MNDDRKGLLDGLARFRGSLFVCSSNAEDGNGPSFCLPFRASPSAESRCTGCHRRCRTVGSTLAAALVVGESEESVPQSNACVT